MKVLICEDNNQISKQITSFIEKYTFIEENSINIVLKSSNPYEVMDYIQTQEVDCFFLDIDLGFPMNGIDLALLIRKRYPLASIIFVTAHSQMLKLTFKYRVEALDFIIKDEFNNLQKNIVGALSTAYNKYEKIGQQQTSNFFQLKIGEYVKNINYDDILYFKTAEVAHKISIITFNGNFDFYQSLNMVENSNENFYRCHKGYVINIKNIEEIDKKLKVVHMKNGETCPIAFRRLKSLEKILMEQY